MSAKNIAAASRPARTTQSLRVLLGILTVVTTTWLSWWYVEFAAHGEFNLLEMFSAVLFTVLGMWISFSFWTATVGFALLLWQFLSGRNKEAVRLNNETRTELNSRTVILIPVYNESPEMVFGSILAMADSLKETGQHEHFDFFVLSDTQKSEIWLHEERTWAQAVREMPEGVSLFYRRRERNTSRKAGNLAEFCRRWGGSYDSMIVLDADSVMEGTTCVEMVCRMERDPQLGILQVPPRPVQRRTLFARLQQFAAAVYGPVFLKGYQAWTQSEGNYFGHNAIIRVAAFGEHCMLPVLSGRAPLGGEILSHDFVEAGLMLKAGYKVETADLGGSYEECPTTVEDYAIRDQRWCQGNLQHARLLFCSGFGKPTRMHFAMGVFSYLSASLWLLFMLTSATGALLDSSEVKPTTGLIYLFVTMFGMLIAPKLWSVFALMVQTESVRLFGGRGRLLASTLIEVVCSVLIAPILAIYHTSFVIYALLGKSIQWHCQTRDERAIDLSDALAHYWPQTVAGLVLATVCFVISISFGMWMLPFTIGLILAVPTVMAMGSSQIGESLREAGLLLIPEEVDPPPLLQNRIRHIGRFHDLLDGHNFSWELFSNPEYIDLHLKILTETFANGSFPVVSELDEDFEPAQWSLLTEQQRLAILSNPQVIRTARRRLVSHSGGASRS